MSDFLIERAGPILQELHSIASQHAAGTNGALTALDYDPTTYSNRDILRHTIKGSPLDPAASNEIAAKVDKRYKSLYEATADCVEIEAIEDVLRSGQNVVLAMDHDELIDAALRPLALANVIKLRNPELVDRNGRPFFRTGLIVSRMVEFIGIPLEGGVVPASMLFAQGFDVTHQTLPSTISTHGKFDKRFMKVYNGIVVHEIASNMRQRAFSNRRPMLLAMAAPGTVNKQLDTTEYKGNAVPKEFLESTMVLGQINHRIADFAANALTFASVAHMSEEASEVLIDGTPLCVLKPRDIERLAGKLITLTTRREGGKTFYIYDSLGKLPVVRK